MPRFGEMYAAQVLINHNPIFMMDGDYTYAEIVAMAGLSGNPTILVHRQGHSFSMIEGDIVTPAQGMRITVAHTNNA